MGINKMWLVLLLSILATTISGDTLLAAIEYCRHGIRAPERPSAFDPYNWPLKELGQLQPAGMRQHYLIGQELRRRWITEMKFLNETYDPNEIDVHSDDFERCIMTAQSQLLGLYPLGTGPLLNNPTQLNASPPVPVDDIKKIREALGNYALPHRFQPIPVKHAGVLDDIILDSNGRCQKLKDEKAEFAFSVPYNSYIEANFTKTLQPQLQKIFGGKTVTYEDSLAMWEFYQINSILGYEVPAGLTPELVEQMGNNMNWRFFTAWLPGNTAKLASSGFLQEVLIFFQAVSQGSLKTKFKFYSGHDSGIAAITKYLDLKPYSQARENPEFASNVMLELYQNGNSTEQYVKVKYNDQEMQIGVCSDRTTCDLPTFAKWLEDNTYDDIVAQCDQKTNHL